MNASLAQRRDTRPGIPCNAAPVHIIADKLPARNSILLTIWWEMMIDYTIDRVSLFALIFSHAESRSLRLTDRLTDTTSGALSLAFLSLLQDEP